MTLDELYLLTGGAGFVWIIGTFMLGFMESGGDNADSGDAGSADTDAGGDMGSADAGADAGGDLSSADAGADAGADGGDLGNLEAQAVAGFKSGLIIRKRRSKAMIILKLLSPSTISTLLFFFGIPGLIIYHMFPFLGPLTLVPALACSVAGYKATSAFSGLLIRKMHASNSYTHEQVIGRMAEISVPITPGKLGEVTYSARGVRETAPARAVDKAAGFPTGSHVMLAREESGIFYVEPWEHDAELGTTLDTTKIVEKH